MLSDPLYLGAAPSSVPNPATAPNTSFTTVLSFALVGGLTAGSTKRKALNVSSFFHDEVEGTANLDDIVLTLSRSETKENAPYVTSRTLIRLDASRVDANGKSVTISAYMVLALPNATMWNEDDMQRLARSLALLVLYGPSTSSSDWTGNASDATILRLLGGEA